MPVAHDLSDLVEHLEFLERNESAAKGLAQAAAGGVQRLVLFLLDAFKRPGAPNWSV